MALRAPRQMERSFLRILWKIRWLAAVQRIRRGIFGVAGRFA